VILPPLRSYQEEAVKTWFESGQKGIISLPTGKGKTVIALKIWELLGKPRMLYVAPTNALIKDLAHKFPTKYKIPEHWISTNPRRPRRITFVTYAMLAVHHPEYGEGFDFYVLDEVHHTAAEKFFENAFLPVIYKSGKPILGLSASPKGSGRYTMDLLKKYLPVVYYKTMDDPELRKYSPTVKVFLVGVNLRTQEAIRYRAMDDEMWELRRKGDFRSIVDAARLLKNPKIPSWRKALAGKYMKLYNAQKRILQGTPDKKRAVIEIIEQHADEPRIMLFADTVDDLVDVINELNRRGIPAFAMTSKTVSAKDVKKLNQDFGTRYQVLGLVKMGEEGLDFPDVSTLIIMGSPKSRRAVVQRSGRVLRWKEGKIANIYVVYARGTKEYDVARRYVKELHPDEVIEIGVEDLEDEEELLEEKPKIEQRPREKATEEKPKVTWIEGEEDEGISVYISPTQRDDLEELIKQYATRARKLQREIQLLSRDWFHNASKLKRVSEEYKIADTRARVLMMVRDYLSKKISFIQFKEYLKPFGYSPNMLTIESWIPSEVRKNLLDKITKDKIEAQQAWKKLFRWG